MNLDLVIGIAGMVGLVVGVRTLTVLRLQAWKQTLYYLISALAVLTWYHLLAGLFNVEGVIVKGTAEIGFAALLTIGIYQMRRTARITGT